MTKLLASRRLPLVLLAGAGILALLQPWAAGAVGASGERGPTESMFVTQIILLIVFGRVFGEIFQRIGQPAVMGQLVAGILLGATQIVGLFGASGASIDLPGQADLNAAGEGSDG